MTITERDVVRLRMLNSQVAKAASQRDREARRLRDRGATWTELGYALGITAQGAQKRYGTSSEREEAHKERAAARALAKARKAARKAAEG